MDFYDEIADAYDDITGAPAREPAAREFVAAFLDRYRPGSALDAACGNGMYALALARAGLSNVAGADLSHGMLDLARQHAPAAGLGVRWVQAPMQTLADALPGPFDAVLCMGNSIPHLLTDADLSAALGAFVRLAAPGGVIVLNLLNYARLQASGERIVGTDRRGQHEYIRFYDFLDADRVRFNILAVDWSSGSERPSHRLHSTTLRPYTCSALRDALVSHGYRDVELFSGLRFAPFDPVLSDTLTLVARTARFSDAVPSLPPLTSLTSPPSPV